MKRRRVYFIVGLFVIVSAFLGAAIIVWIGASQYFQKGTTYAAYFDESVQGLQVDSAVKYRGVPVGTVKSIKVAPGYELIEVLIKADLSEGQAKQLVARLRVAGITGIVFIELDRMTPADKGISPKLTFTPKHPVIATRPSDVRQIFSGLDEIINNVRGMDLKGIAGEIKATAKAVGTFVRGERMQQVMVSLQAVAQNLERISGRVNVWVHEGGAVNDILADAGETVKEAKLAITSAREAIEKLRLAETSEKVNSLVESVANRTNTVALEMQITTENIRKISERLENLAGRLETDPSEIIFSTAPPRGR